MSNKSSPNDSPRKICRGIVIREKTPGAGDIRLFVNYRGQRRCLDILDIDEMIAFAHDLAGKMRKKENIWNDPRWDRYQAKEDLPVPCPTLTEYWSTFDQEYLNSAAVRESTAMNYRDDFRIHILPILGEYQLSKLDHGAVERFILELTKKKRTVMPKKPENVPKKPNIDVQNRHNLSISEGLARPTIEKILRELRRVLSRAFMTDLIDENPLSPRNSDRMKELKLLYKNVPKRHSKMQVLDPEQISKFLETAHRVSPKHYVRFFLEISTGVRVGELTALYWDDFDLENTHTVLIQRTWSRRTRKIHATKSGHHRSIDLHPALVESLLELRKERRREWLGREKTPLIEQGLWCDQTKAPKLVFCNEEGGIEDYINVTNRHFRKILREAGLPWMRIHDLRHCYATALLSLGADDKYVQGQLGHSSITLTKDLYGQTYEGKFRRRWIDELFPLLTKAGEIRSSEANK
jgi:integrase